MGLDVNTLFLVTIYVEAMLGPAAAVRLDPELEHPRGRLVGLRASAARRLGRAVRHVRIGVGRDLDRSRQRRAVHRLRRDLVGRAVFDGRRSRCISSAARCCGFWSATSVLRRLARRQGAARLRHHHRLHLGHGLRVLARAQRAAGVALAGDLHAVRAWRAVPAAHAAGAGAAVVADQPGVRQRVADRA